jgi:hypothetical protein
MTVAPKSSPNATLSRRHLVGLLGTGLALAACSKAAPVADTQWSAFSETGTPIDHSAWDAFLGKFVQSGVDGISRVDYATIISAGKGELKAYIDALQKVSVADLTKAEQFAFWVNLYNAATVDAIVEGYPVASIRELGSLGQGPWKDNRLKVGTTDLSLDDIEHKILRPIWKDVRVHYAVNCASIGCPNLATQAYTGARLDAMLNAAATAYVSHPRGFANKDGALVASSIFDWYGTDWAGEAGVLSHARGVADANATSLLKTATKINKYDYDWSLNDVSNV